ncbi:phage tail fiber repeat protein [Haemophilus influenzae]|nr:phage tail fiber repeat protein [Haemophilus influenzae]
MPNKHNFEEFAELVGGDISNINRQLNSLNNKQSPATTLAGYGIGNFKVEEFRGDINTLKTDGIYAIRQASLTQNLPVSISCHIQVIAGGDSSWCRQLAYVAYSSDVYERHQTSYQTDSWSPWVKIDSLDKIPNSKKSSAVNSESEDTIATSKAVKTAYDKALEAISAINQSNGNYRKIGNFGILDLPNGMMIQTYVIRQSNLVDYRERSFYWAKAFEEPPLLLTQVHASGWGSYEYGVHITANSNYNKRSVNYYEYKKGSSELGSIEIHFLAIGRSATGTTTTSPPTGNGRRVEDFSDW